jgi:predicted nicotinamide N-methyase
MSAYRVRYETVEFGSLDVHVCALRDKQEFSDDDGEAARLGITSANWSLFGVLWASSIVLAQLMCDHNIEGLRILEVGCGLGLASLVLASRDADITATDYHPEAQRFLERNRQLNQSGAIDFLRTSWEDDGEDESLGRFDLIIGSEILYEQGLLSQLSGFMDRRAKPDCKIMLIDPKRGNRGKFSALMHADGWTSSRVDVQPDPPFDVPYSGQILHFSRHSIT